MALSAPTLTAPPGFALWPLRRASAFGACPPPLILGAGGGVAPARNRRKRTSFRCTFRHGGRGTEACIPAAAPRKRTGFLFAPAHKNPARFPAGASGAQKRRTPLPPSAAPAGITHYTLLRKVVCQRGENSPLWKPPLPACGPGQGPTAHINPSINLSRNSVYGLTGATNCDTIRV